MKRLFIFWVILLPALTQHVHAQYYSVNYDARTVAAMAAAFGTEVVAESYYREQVDEDRKSTRLNSSHIQKSRMPSSA